MTDFPSHPDTPRNRGDRDAPHVSPVTPAEDARSVLLNRVSWGAVLAGVVVALVAQLILNMIGIGIGAATLDPAGAADQNPSARGFSIGAAVWWTVSGIVAALVGGFAAGRLSGQPKEASPVATCRRRIPAAIPATSWFRTIPSPPPARTDRESFMPLFLLDRDSVVVVNMPAAGGCW